MARKSSMIEIPTEELHETIEQRAAQMALNNALGEDGEADGFDDADELRALSELDGAGDVRWNIHQTMPAAQAGWVGVLSTAELSLERLASEYGVGRYRIRGTRPNGTIAGQRTVTISKVPKSLLPVPASAPVSGGNSMTDFLAMMEAKERARSQAMKEWAVILAPIFAPIIPQLFGNKGPSLTELTQTLANMKNLQGNDSQISKITELKELIEVVSTIGGDKKDTGSTWVDLIRDGVKELGPAMINLIPRGNPAPVAFGPPANLAPNPPPQIPATVASKTEPQDMNLLLLSWFKEQLNGLIYQASLNKSPELYAEVVLDNMPAGVDPAKLKEYLSRDDWWQLLSSFAPGVQPYPAWFAEARTFLIEGIDEMTAPPESPAAPLATRNKQSDADSE